MKTAQKVRRLRRACGWTQLELAEKVGVSQTAISQIESGETRNPHPSTMRKLASVFDASIADLLDDVG